MVIIVRITLLRFVAVAVIALILRFGFRLFHRLRLLPDAAALRFLAIQILVIHRIVGEDHLLRVPTLLQVQLDGVGRGGWLRFTGDRRRTRRNAVQLTVLV